MISSLFIVPGVDSTVTFLTRRQARKNLGLTLRQCALALGTSRHVLGRIENHPGSHSHLVVCYDLFLGVYAVESLRSIARKS